MKNPIKARAYFLHVLNSLDYENCAFGVGNVLLIFKKLGKLDEFLHYFNRWVELLLCALNKPDYSESYKHNRALFKIAIYLNDRYLAEKVSQVYLNEFDLSYAFPKTTKISRFTYKPCINKNIKIQNRKENKPRVLIHVDGDMAFHPSKSTELTCAERMLDFLLSYGYPATVSFTCQDIIYHKIEKKDDSVEEKISELVDNSFIALASHGFTHPMSWQEERFDINRETYGAKRFLENWAKKEVSIFLYTGDSNLTSQQLWEVEKCGMLGVNKIAYFKWPIIKYVDDWFQFLAPGINDYPINYKDFADYNINKFEQIKKGELDYPISVYIHHYAMLEEERIREITKIFEWLKENSKDLYFDTLHNYYGELRGQLIYS